jgi:hypothetical protein
MGKRVVGFNDANPDTDPGNTQSASEAKVLVERMAVVAAAQRAGLLNKATGSAEKARLRHEILKGPVAHLAEVGKRAQRSKQPLGLTFRYKPGAQSYIAFLNTVRSMQAAAEANKEVLMKFGLSEAVLAQLGELLDRFDAAVALCDQGRTEHKGATQQLEEQAQELASIVRTMDARNRLRFQGNRQLLESWISASTVLGVRRAEGESAGGETPVVEGPAGSTQVGSQSGSQGSPQSGTQDGTPSAGGEVRSAA